MKSVSRGESSFHIH